MNDKTSIEEAADRLEAIARTRRVQEALSVMVEEFEIETTLKKASGLDGLRELTAADMVPPPPLSGEAVARALDQMARTDHE